MPSPCLRPATYADLPRVTIVRHATAENRLSDPSRVSEAEVIWYVDEAIFLVSEDDEGIQGFVCANPQTGLLWALFVIDDKHGRGHGSALHEAALIRLREAGHRQAFLTTGRGTKAEAFYKARGWHSTGMDRGGEVVLRCFL
ncbi:MAG: GNAT family N-acetyltransferase [Alphaproteobacteria bacterium]